MWILRAAADFGDLAAAGKTSILGRACKLGNVMLSSGSAPKWINRIQRLLDKRRYTTFCKYKVTATFQEDGTTKGSERAAADSDPISVLAEKATSDMFGIPQILQRAQVPMLESNKYVSFGFVS